MCCGIYLDKYFKYSIKIFFFFFMAIMIRLVLQILIILDNNNIGVEGAKALAEALKINKNLT